MTITIIIIQIIILIFLGFLIVLIKKNSNNKDNNNEQLLKEDINQNINQSLGILNNNLSNQMSNKNVETLNVLKNITDTLDKKISNQNIEQVNALKNTINSLDNKMAKQSQMNSEYIKEIITRVTHLDNIKNQMVDLNVNISSLERILNDKKARGTFGEVRLKQIFEAVFGEGQSKIYEEQYMLSNGKRVDFMLHGPYPLNNLAIDSKFPLENYLNIMDAENESDLKVARRAFKKDLKKHIDDIANKYIIENETSDQAIMFIPSEAIFAHIHAYDEDIVNYSYSKKVWLTSPSTLMAIINLILIVLKDIKRNESYDELFLEISKLKVEFERYTTRWQNLSRSMEKVYKDTNDLSITANKLSKKFEDIEKVNVTNENNDEE